MRETESFAKALSEAFEARVEILVKSPMKPETLSVGVIFDIDLYPHAIRGNVGPDQLIKLIEGVSKKMGALALREPFAEIKNLKAEIEEYKRTVEDLRRYETHYKLAQGLT